MNAVVVVVVRFEVDCLGVGATWPTGGMPSVGIILKGAKPVFMRVSEKTTENSERLGRQERPGVESETCRLPVLECRIEQPLVTTELFAWHE